MLVSGSVFLPSSFSLGRDCLETQLASHQEVGQKWVLGAAPEDRLLDVCVF